MAEFTFTSLEAFKAQFKKDMKAREKRCRTAQRKAARTTRNFIVREKVPKAFGELIDSASALDTEFGAQVIFDAPHAGAVENGSRPHTPPIGPLIAWVILRGVEGLGASGRVKSNRVKGGGIKAWQKEAARSIATSLHSSLGGNKGAAAWRSRHQNVVRNLTPATLGQIDSGPEVRSIAYAIQQKIAKEGTKPVRYVGSSLNEAVAELDHFIQRALPDP
jgi:hypothetical protein